MKKTDLKAGMPLDVIFENELNTPSAHYMKAAVYDIDDQFVVISQTSPALTGRFLNRRLLITFLVRSDNRILRFGIPALFTELIAAYPMSSGKTAEALRLQKQGQVEPTDFRMYFRVKPPSSADLGLFLEEKKVQLLDISIGGAKFSYSERQFFHPGQNVSFKLVLREAIFNVDAVVRKVQETSGGSRNLEYVSVEFRHRDRKIETALGGAIMDIERSLLSRGAV